MLNDAAREALVSAALKGIKQAYGTWHDVDGGMCAGGVLHVALGHRVDDIHCTISDELCRGYGLTEEEIMDLVDANDKGMDFLTIARKFGNTKDSE